MLLTVRWGQFKPSQPSRRVAKVGPNQTVTTTPRHPRRRGHFKPPSRGQIRLSRPGYEAHQGTPTPEHPGVFTPGGRDSTPAAGLPAPGLLRDRSRGMAALSIEAM